MTAGAVLVGFSDDPPTQGSPSDRKPKQPNPPNGESVIGWLLLVLALIAVCLSACEAVQSPKKTVLDYLKAESINDIKTMQALTEPGKQAGGNWFNAMLGGHVKQTDLSGLSLTITYPETERARVHVSGKIKYALDNPLDLPMLPTEIKLTLPIDRSFFLIKIEGIWYIQPQEIKQ